MSNASNAVPDAGRPSATEAIDADLETLTEKLCKEAERDGHSETVVALVARMARKAYMEGWYRGHQCASDLAARIDRELAADRDARRAQR